MTPQEVEPFLTQQCKLYQINPNWLKAIISTESSWNPYAIRYEVNYSYLYQPEKFIQALKGQVSLATEIATQKMSWGLGQIMGALAREQGHTGLIGELVNPQTNIRHICIRLDFLKKKAFCDDDVFAMYNAGPGGIKKVNHQYPNQNYVDKVKGFLSQLE